MILNYAFEVLFIVEEYYRIMSSLDSILLILKHLMWPLNVTYVYLGSNNATGRSSDEGYLIMCNSMWTIRWSSVEFPVGLILNYSSTIKIMMIIIIAANIILTIKVESVMVRACKYKQENKFPKRCALSPLFPWWKNSTPRKEAQRKGHLFSCFCL